MVNPRHVLHTIQSSNVKYFFIFQISMSVCSSLVQMEELASIFKDHTSVDVLKAGLDKTVK